MKKNLTEIILVLDRSGSMLSIKNSTIEGVNSFLREQINAPGEARWTLVQFDDQYEPGDRSVPVGLARALDHSNYNPRGWTALYGAIGRTVEEAGRRQENSSHKYEWSRMWVRERVRLLIEQQKNQWGWQVVYIGANQDAILDAQMMGIDASNAINYAANDIGTHALYASVASNVVGMRSGRKASMAWTEEQRLAQKKAMTK